MFDIIKNKVNDYKTLETDIDDMIKQNDELVEKSISFKKELEDKKSKICGYILDDISKLIENENITDKIYCYQNVLNKIDLIKIQIKNRICIGTLDHIIYKKEYITKILSKVFFHIAYYNTTCNNIILDFVTGYNKQDRKKYIEIFLTEFNMSIIKELDKCIEYHEMINKVYGE